MKGNRWMVIASVSDKNTFRGCGIESRRCRSDEALCVVKVNVSQAHSKSVEPVIRSPFRRSRRIISAANRHSALWRRATVQWHNKLVHPQRSASITGPICIFDLVIDVAICKAGIDRSIRNGPKPNIRRRRQRSVASIGRPTGSTLTTTSATSTTSPRTVAAYRQKCANCGASRNPAEFGPRHDR